MMVTSAQVTFGGWGWGWGWGVVNLHLVKYGDIGLGDPWHFDIDG